jgi:hypothetical protein
MIYVHAAAGSPCPTEKTHKQASGYSEPHVLSGSDATLQALHCDTAPEQRRDKGLRRLANVAVVHTIPRSA